MHPSRYLSKRFPSKGNKDFTSLSLALDKSSSFEHLEMLRHGVQSRVVRLCDVQESSWSVCELPNNRSPSGVRNGCQNVRQLIHAKHYTKRCNVLQIQLFCWIAGAIFAIRANSGRRLI